jgi:hypothetical protein
MEDGHTLAMCPTYWRKIDHQVGFTCGNVQQWINQGYGPCTEGDAQDEAANAAWTILTAWGRDSK